MKEGIILKVEALLIILIILYAFLPKAVISDTSQGWLAGWAYRKGHIILQTSGAGIGYQISLYVMYGNGTDSGNTVYLGGGGQSDFGDVRVTASDGLTVLAGNSAGWMEELVESSYCLIWFKDPDNLNVSDSTVYVYYGNPTVSWSDDPSNTFEFFEGFNNKPISTWNEWGGNGATLTATVSDGIVKVEQTPYGNPYWGMYETNSAVWHTNQAIRGRVKFGVLNSAYNGLGFVGSSMPHGDADENCISISQDNDDEIMRATNGDGLWNRSSGLPDSTNTNFQTFNTIELDNWVVVEMGRTPDIVVFSKHGGVANETVLSTLYVSTLPAYFKFHLCTDDFMWGDWVLLRKFVYPEPVHSPSPLSLPTSYIVVAAVVMAIVILATRNKKKRR